MTHNLVNTRLRALFCATLLFCTPAWAAEPLEFGQTPYKSSEILIKAYLQNELQEDPKTFTIATTDLNHDGLDEFILKPVTCLTCSFFIIAETDHKLFELGRIEAFKLTLANRDTHGIRDIWAFNDKTNDYTYDIYVWEPERSRYIIAE